ncbi:hypothetical protein EDD65_1231 [Keratinibaculum paraultunense]|uniref:Uncharacterized protein n=1 Tax=Keratinibaculum paraultunense TaxID=1278232 RepID=A0A4R3KN79_9FIRM|nr:hypothetical protein [Keratinibaculum paraultunense]QQY80380.1 hypothetical protein JL105_03360 [Keratinibaculum paraultunense]TCS85383.1 hypothetical protein EDD65_1231 [Keratinibaculum paraultunense]
MRKFDKISIQEMSKEDMLMIIKALEYTGANTNIQAFLTLRDNILKELASLAESSENEFLAYLNDSY